MPVGHRIGWIAQVVGFVGGFAGIPGQSARTQQVQTRRLRLKRRKVAVTLPCVRSGLEAGRVFEIEAGLVLQIVGKELRLDLLAELAADRPWVLHRTQVPSARCP